MESTVVAEILNCFGESVHVYIVGGQALLEWSNGDWVSNDIDIIIMSNHEPIAVTHKIASLNAIRFAKFHITRRSNIPTDIVGYTHIGMYDKWDISHVDSKHYINGMQQFMDTAFDLNICCIGYRVTKYDVKQSIWTLLAVMKRKGVAMPIDIRKMLASWLIESKPQPRVAITWVYGNRFDEAAASKTPGHAAILDWQKSSMPLNPSYASKCTRGLNRILKYKKRGFIIAEYPSRVDTQVYLRAISTADRAMATDEYKRRKKRKKDDEISALMNKKLY